MEGLGGLLVCLAKQLGFAVACALSLLERCCHHHHLPSCTGAAAGMHRQCTHETALHCLVVPGQAVVGAMAVPQPAAAGFICVRRDACRLQLDISLLLAAFTLCAPV